MTTGVVIGRYGGDHVSTFTSIFCRNTHVGIWRRIENVKGAKNDITGYDSFEMTGDNNGGTGGKYVYEVLLMDLLMLEPPKFIRTYRLDCAELNSGAINLEYRNYGEYLTSDSGSTSGQSASRFPSIDNIMMIEFDRSSQFIKSLMSGEMFGFEAAVKMIYQLFPSLSSEITTVSDLHKFGKTYKTVKSEYIDRGAEFVSRNVSGEMVETHLMKARAAINLKTNSQYDVPYIDIKTLMSELHHIEELMAPLMSKKGTTFEVPRIRDNDDEKSTQCILTENVRSLNLKLSLGKKEDRREIRLTTLGDEIESLTLEELKELHQFLATTNIPLNVDDYTKKIYTDRINLRIVEMVNKKVPRRRRRRRARRGATIDSRRDESDVDASDEDYMSVSYRSSRTQV